jgi:hypothetical protein
VSVPGAAAHRPLGFATKPGAFGITTIWNSDPQAEEIRALTRSTATEMLSMEGFIGVSFFRIGGRGVTISAWKKPECGCGERLPQAPAYF